MPLSCPLALAGTSVQCRTAAGRVGILVLLPDLRGQASGVSVDVLLTVGCPSMAFITRGALPLLICSVFITKGC